MPPKALNSTTLFWKPGASTVPLLQMNTITRNKLMGIMSVYTESIEKAENLTRLVSDLFNDLLNGRLSPTAYFELLSNVIRKNVGAEEEDCCEERVYELLDEQIVWNKGRTKVVSTKDAFHVHVPEPADGGHLPMDDKFFEISYTSRCSDDVVEEGTCVCSSGSPMDALNAFTSSYDAERYRVKSIRLLSDDEVALYKSHITLRSSREPDLRDF